MPASSRTRRALVTAAFVACPWHRARLDLPGRPTRISATRSPTTRSPSRWTRSDRLQRVHGAMARADRCVRRGRRRRRRLQRSRRPAAARSGCAPRWAAADVRLARRRRRARSLAIGAEWCLRPFRRPSAVIAAVNGPAVGVSADHDAAWTSLWPRSATLGFVFGAARDRPQARSSLGSSRLVGVSPAMRMRVETGRVFDADEGQAGSAVRSVDPGDELTRRC